MQKFKILACHIGAFIAFAGVSTAEELVLKKGDRLAVIGDSITEQKGYSKFIETYLLACCPELQIQTFQFGWSGERASGFAQRMENDLVPWHPNVVTTCYGMNDGSYRAYDEQIGEAYKVPMLQIVERMKKAGAIVVVGSPGVVDSFTWKPTDPDFDKVYNANLEHLGAISADLAKANNFPYADVHHAMEAAMISAKAAYGDEYPVAGGDGIHPSANGHLIMAYAFLKALGLNGDIGTVTVDLAAGKAEATAGHKVLACKDGKVELESSRYPFCFSGGEKDANGTRSILPHIRFNEDLNRFVLKATNLRAASADVTFGTETKNFTKDQLAAGINLAAEFLDNPFVGPFNDVTAAVAKKQQFETLMIKGFITSFRQFSLDFKGDDEAKAAFATLRRKMTELDDKQYAEAKAAVKPVRYTLSITPKE